MKKLILIVLISITGTNLIAQDPEYNDWLLHQRLPDWAKKAFIKQVSDYKLSDFINPFYVEADFNGDGNVDIAVTVESLANNKKGILIIHQGTKQRFVIGAGNKLSHLDDLWWMDIIKVNYDLNNHELTYKEDGDIDDAIPINMCCPSIHVGKSESSSGLIYWDGKEYNWAQMGD